MLNQIVNLKSQKHRLKIKYYIAFRELAISTTLPEAKLLMSNSYF